MVDKLTDLQKHDLEDLPKHALPLYQFILRVIPVGNHITPELAEARKKLEEAEFWIQQHIVRHGSGKSEA